MDTGKLALKGARIGSAGKVKDVRADHVYRYRWAAERLSGHAVDAGCNCGYGAAILADAGLTVTAVDIWSEGIDYAKRHWDRPGIVWSVQDLTWATLPACNGVVAFEVIEHIEEPERFLRLARSVSPVLLASVPNEDIWPWSPRLGPVHQRHYRRADLDRMLRRAGWHPVAWWGQRDGHSPMEPELNGRTLIVECR